MKLLFQRLFREKLSRICILFLLLVLFLGAAAPILPLQNAEEIDFGQKYLLPSSAHWLGTDQLGRDLLSRVIWGIRSTVFISIITMTLTFCLGAAYGAISGMFKGKVDSIMMRLCDVMMAFPSEVLILAIVGTLGPGLENVVFACVVSKWAWYARMSRSAVRSVLNKEHIRFAYVIGAPRSYILQKHILPSVLGDFCVLMTLDVGSVVLMLSALSFLGLGVQPPTPEWGMMLSEAKEVLSTHPWQMFPAGISIVSLVCAFNFLGDCLRDSLDLSGSK